MIIMNLKYTLRSLSAEIGSPEANNGLLLICILCDCFWYKVYKRRGELCNRRLPYVSKYVQGRKC